MQAPLYFVMISVASSFFLMHQRRASSFLQNKLHPGRSMVNINDSMVQDRRKRPTNLVYISQGAHHCYACPSNDSPYLPAHPNAHNLMILSLAPALISRYHAAL